MEAAREELRRVVRLAGVNKITQLSPDALASAANRALAAVFKLAPPTEVGALDGEVRKLTACLVDLGAMIRRLVLGRGALAGAMPAAAALTTVRAASYAAHHSTVPVRLQLFKAGASMLLSASHLALAGLGPANTSAGYLASRHLEAAQALLELMLSCPADATRELCAAGTEAFQPQLTVRWLARITAQLAARPTDVAVWSDHTRYAFVCKQLFHADPVPEHMDFSAVQEALSPEESAAIARLLLQHTLHAAMAAVASSVQMAAAAAAASSSSNGSLPAGVTVTQEEKDFKALGWIGALFRVPSLRPAVLQATWADLSGVQRTASQLVAALPAACPPTLPPFLFVWAWQAALEALLLPLAAIKEQQQLGSTQRANSERAAALAAANCLPHLAAAVRCAPACHEDTDKAVANMCRLAVQVVRRISAAVPSDGADWEAHHCATLLDAADALLRTLPTLHRVQQAGEQQHQPAAAEQADEQRGQCATAEQPGDQLASEQLANEQRQPHAAEQSDGGQEEPAERAAMAAALLRTECLRLMCSAAALANSLLRREAKQPGQGAEAASQGKALVLSAWRLHTTACRWVHWAVAADDAQDLASWHTALYHLGLVWDSWPAPAIDERTRRGARAAHLAAVEAIAASQGPVQQWEPRQAQDWAVHLAWLAAQFEVESLLPQLGEMMAEATHALSQSIGCEAASSSEGPSHVHDVMVAWLAYIACAPSAVHRLLPDGGFIEALDAAVAAGCWVQVIRNIHSLLFWTVDKPPKGSAQQPSINKLLEWLEPLMLSAANPTPSQVAGFKQWLHSECLPALAVAAAAMQKQQEQRPWTEQAEVLLESGLAAASRSCAYLWCANLGGEGGPAAGQGAGSAKCSACREAWYCSRACSEADWRRGGHRRLCKAMAAWHQQQKEQRVAGQLERLEVAGQG